MATKKATVEAAPSAEAGVSPARRKIPGNLPYLPASGTLKKALDRLIDAQRPERFNADFLENVLKLKGGTARATIPIMKKMGFLASDSSTTELYAKFRTASGRGPAALQGLRSAFPEIFRRSEYAHAVGDAKLKDIIVEITGLNSNDLVAAAIRSTFNVIKSFVPSDVDTAVQASEQLQVQVDESSSSKYQPTQTAESQGTGEIRLAYNINIVLPETSDLNVLSAIFKSIRENLMR